MSSVGRHMAMDKLKLGHSKKYSEKKAQAPADHFLPPTGGAALMWLRDIVGPYRRPSRGRRWSP